jgi:hypothetical protein
MPAVKYEDAPPRMVNRQLLSPPTTASSRGSSTTLETASSATLGRHSSTTLDRDSSATLKTEEPEPSLTPEPVWPLEAIPRSEEPDARRVLPPRQWGMGRAEPSLALAGAEELRASDPRGPVARAPYLGIVSADGARALRRSARPGGPRLLDLLALLDMERFGVMRWAVVEKEGEIADYEARDEDKVMLCVWARWIFLNRCVRRC